MERLTARAKSNNHIWCLGHCEEQCEKCEHFNKMINKLAEYEDAEEQGLLLRLPVAIGSEVWKIINQRDNFTDIPYKIVTIVHFRLDMLKEIGKTVFLTKEEAEMKLAELTENRNCPNEDSPEQALEDMKGGAE